MAVEQGGQATGAAQDGHDLRRRNVPDQSGSNGSITQLPQEEDQKKLRKVGPNIKRGEHQS